MTTDSEQAHYPSNPSQEPLDEKQSSGQQGPRTVPMGSEPDNSRDENLARDAPSAAASSQGQQQASATRQQTRAAAQTSQEELAVRSEDASRFPANTRKGTDGNEHSLVSDPSGYARRWESIQVGFVDDPRSAVQEAETLVSDVMREMTGMFEQQRQQLEEQWSGDNEASTDAIPDVLVAQGADRCGDVGNAAGSTGEPGGKSDQHGARPTRKRKETLVEDQQQYVGIDLLRLR